MGWIWTLPWWQACLWMAGGLLVGAGTAWGARNATLFLPSRLGWYDPALAGSDPALPDAPPWKPGEVPPSGIPLVWWFKEGRPAAGRTDLLLDAALVMAGCLVAAIQGPGIAELASGLLLVAACGVMARVDHDHHMILDHVAMPLVLAGLLFSPFEPDDYARIVGMSLGAVSLWFVFALFGRLKGMDTMAGGDVMLAAAAGAWLGGFAMGAYLLLSVAFYVVHVLGRRLGRTGSLRSEEPDWAPFGPSMCLALVLLSLFHP